MSFENAGCWAKGSVGDWIYNCMTEVELRSYNDCDYHLMTRRLWSGSYTAIREYLSDSLDSKRIS